MSDAEKKTDYKVSDHRRFVVDEAGHVDARPDEQKEDAPAPEPETRAPRAESAKAQQAKADFEKECGPCEENYQDLPPIDFTSLVFSLSTSAMVCLGLLPDPQTNEQQIDLGLAKQNIDILGMLQEKTKGNLDKDEEEFLENSLYDLRMRFVEACQKTASQ